MDILEEIRLTNSKSVETPMDPNVKLLPRQGEPFSDPKKYKRLVGKLNYLTVTHPDISFVVSVVSQFLNSPCVDHWNAVIRILKYIKGSLRKGLLYGHNNHTRVVCYSDADWVGSMSDRKVRNKMLWQDLVLKQNIELWFQLLVSLFVLNSYSNNCNFEKSFK